MIKRVGALVLALVFAAGFGRLALAKSEEVAGAKKTISIIFDNGITEGLDARQAKSREQLGAWMAPDLVRVFERYAKSGFEAKLIVKETEFVPAEGSYLLKVKIVDYNPGSKAARMIVGFGAGGVSLKINYEIYSDLKIQAVLTKDDGVYSGREWVNAARKLNENTAKAVTETLSK